MEVQLSFKIIQTLETCLPSDTSDQSVPKCVHLSDHITSIPLTSTWNEDNIVSLRALYSKDDPLLAEYIEEYYLTDNTLENTQIADLEFRQVLSPPSLNCDV